MAFFLLRPSCHVPETSLRHLITKKKTKKSYEVFGNLHHVTSYFFIQCLSVCVLGHVAMLAECYSLAFTKLKRTCFNVVLALYATTKKGHEVCPYSLGGKQS